MPTGGPLAQRGGVVWHNHVFSPDGNWLLWQDGQTWRAFALDGSRQYEWPRDPKANRYRRQIYWCSDSRRWLEPRYDNTYRVNGGMLHHLSPGTPDIARTFANSGGHWILGTTPQNHLLTSDLFFGPAGTYTLYDTPLDEDHAATRAITVRLPANASLRGVDVSLDGTRLLWQLQIRQELPGPPLVQRILRWFGLRPQERQGLWVSQSDGSGLREIGHVPLIPQTGGRSRDLHSARWLHDSKHILFIYNDKLYKTTPE